MLAIVRARSVILIPVLATLLASVVVSQNNDEAFSRNKDSVSPRPELAAVVIQPSKLIYAVGEGITATVSLVAGNKGVYVSRHLGEAMGNVAGLSLWLEYPDGKFAETCSSGGFADFAGPLPSPSGVFKQEFIFLKPGEVRKLEMGISCPVKKPGAYRLQAAYSPNYPQTDKVAELPETHGLVLRKRIQAELVGIEIR